MIRLMTSSPARVFAAVSGVIWAYVEPTINVYLICIAATVIDIVTAWRLNRRVRKAFPNAGADGKLKSKHMKKIIPDLCVLFLCINLANAIDMDMIPEGLSAISLKTTIACAYTLCTFVSILENESSCNGSVWAVFLQKYLVSKVSRHIDIDEEEVEALVHGRILSKRKAKVKATIDPGPPLADTTDCGGDAACGSE